MATDLQIRAVSTVGMQTVLGRPALYTVLVGMDIIHGSDDAFITVADYRTVAAGMVTLNRDGTTLLCGEVEQRGRPISWNQISDRTGLRV